MRLNFLYSSVTSFVWRCETPLSPSCTIAGPSPCCPGLSLGTSSCRGSTASAKSRTRGSLCGKNALASCQTHSRMYGGPALLCIERETYVYIYIYMYICICVSLSLSLSISFSLFLELNAIPCMPINTKHTTRNLESLRVGRLRSANTPQLRKTP